jgi:hypothetical protein
MSRKTPVARRLEVNSCEEYDALRLVFHPLLILLLRFAADESPTLRPAQ